MNYIIPQYICRRLNPDTTAAYVVNADTAVCYVVKAALAAQPELLAEYPGALLQVWS